MDRRGLWVCVLVAAFAAALGSCGAADAAVTLNTGGVTREVQGVLSTPSGIYVSGDTVVNSLGQTIHLHGVNRAGTEYACIQGWGLFDGPSDAASVQAMASWNINIVRIPLNEDCWLGLGGVNPAYSGANYVNAITSYVKLLHQNGMYAELSLMWGAPGTAQATYQSGAPDEDHSPAMWASMAQTFKNDPNVILAPWGETYVDWNCFMNGCNNEASFGTGPWDGDTQCTDGTGAPIPGCYHYTTAGMNQAVSVMRGAGYNGPIAIPCIDFADICADPASGGPYAGGTWVSEHPSDPDKSLIAEVHIYGGQLCSSTACLDATVSPILTAGYPVIFGETGEAQGDCSSSAVSTFMPWADAHGVGYEAWTWDAWPANCQALISDYSGTPANAFGAYVQSHYKSLN